MGKGDSAALAKRPKEDLSVTALYTSQAWLWGGFSCADLLATPEARTVFRVTNFALAIAKWFIPGLKPLRTSLVHRHAMIDHLAREAAPDEVLELAAGFSRRGAALTEDAGVRFTEVDLGPVIRRKRELLERTDRGREVLGRDNLRLVEADVRDADLAAIAEPSGKRLFVIAEGLLMYLSAEAQRELWKRVRELLQASSSGTFVFDLVPKCEEPKPGAFGRALGWLMKRFTGGKGFERDERTRGDIAGELENVGFSRVEVIEPRDVAGAWQLPFADVATQQLVFVCHR